jgi:hypothetical protein
VVQKILIDHFFTSLLIKDGLINMPNNKKHHFVPKFYMKFFSPNGKSVNLLHMKREIKLLGIPLKNQCYRDYFYGEDGKLEDALGKIESEAAEAIRRLIANERVPLHTSTDFSTILVFYWSSISNRLSS